MFTWIYDIWYIESIVTMHFDHKTDFVTQTKVNQEKINCWLLIILYRN